MAENTKRFVFLHVKSSIAKTMEEMDKIAILVDGYHSILILRDHHQSGSDTLGKKKRERRGIYVIPVVGARVGWYLQLFVMDGTGFVLNCFKLSLALLNCCVFFTASLNWIEPNSLQLPENPKLNFRGL